LEKNGAKQKEGEVALEIGRREIISYYAKVIIDFVLAYGAITFFTLLLYYGLADLIITGDIYSVSTIPAGIYEINTLSISLVLMSATYLVSYFLYKRFLPSHLRVLQSMLVVMFGVFLDFVSNTIRLNSLTSSSFLFNLLFFIELVFCVYISNILHRSFSPNWKALLTIFAVYLCSLAVLPFSLPMSSVFFVINKIAGYSMWLHLRRR